MKRVTGIGGVFFKSSNPKKLQAWYKEHLGIAPAGEGGVVFEWRENNNRSHIGHTVWALFAKTSKYFKPSGKEFMLNYRVENLEALLRQLRKEGVKIVGKIEAYDYGKFGWIMDPEGNKIELWEPNDEVFRKGNKLDPEK